MSSGTAVFWGLQKPLNTCSLDEMGHHIDDLEKNIAELMTQFGMDDK